LAIASPEEGGFAKPNPPPAPPPAPPPPPPPPPQEPPSTTPPAQSPPGDVEPTPADDLLHAKIDETYDGLNPVLKILLFSPLHAISDSFGKDSLYGTTPHGRPYTRHYILDTGPYRNIPGSVVDETIETNPGKPVENGKTVYYDPDNNVTVVTGDGQSIVSARKGDPRSGQ
jgi:hypothetical protein